MDPDLHYRRAAALMLRRFGPRAQDRAAKLAAEHQANGHKPGWVLWSRIHKAIDELRYRAGPPFPANSEE
jgi:hypothetical protein